MTSTTEPHPHDAALATVPREQGDSRVSRSLLFLRSSSYIDAASDLSPFDTTQSVFILLQNLAFHEGLIDSAKNRPLALPTATVPPEKPRKPLSPGERLLNLTQ